LYKVPHKDQVRKSKGGKESKGNKKLNPAEKGAYPVGIKSHDEVKGNQGVDQDI